jgi:YesN/AraC family two-component response regulator
MIKVVEEAISSLINFDKHHAQNGIEAIEICKTKKPNVVFLDINMPDMDGFEALKKIKEEHSATHVIMLSANFQPKVVEKVLSMGALAFIRKPTNPRNIKPTAEEIQKLLLENKII